MTQSATIHTTRNLSWNPVSNKPLINSSFMGSWSLSSLKDEGVMEYMNEDFDYEFSNNGKVSVQRTCTDSVTVNEGSVIIDTLENTVDLHMDGESIKFGVLKMTPLEMILKHNSGLEYYFLKNA